MAKKPPKKSSAKRRASSSAESVAALKKTIAAQEKTIAAQAQEIREGVEQQTATSEILRVIASSPTNLQPVLDVVAENAAHLCDASDAAIWRADGDKFWLAASHGSIPIPRPDEARSMTRSGNISRAMIDRETIHIHDLSSTEAQAEFPAAWAYSQSVGIRTVLVTPLLREGIAIGAIQIRRLEVRPFSEKQTALLKTFADQAVIAIENVRLFKELGERNAELRESLEHQTATGEVLGIISRSPTDVQPVLYSIVESAARVCGIDDVVLRLREKDAMVARAHVGPVPISAGRVKVSTDDPRFRWMREHGTLHLPDYRAQNDFPTGDSVVGFRTFLSAPLRQHEELIGVLSARRMELCPFTPAQIKLLETFADQAVIAIENVRLFQELKEALEQQTATSEILGVIASSPTDIQPVLDVIVANAARLCDSNDAQLRLLDDTSLRLAASYGSFPNPVRELAPMSRQILTGRAIINRQMIHVHDMERERPTEYPEAPMDGTRTALAIPLLRESIPIGAILIRRQEVRPFTDKQVALLQTFADQAVIAIENVRLFKELQERNAELREALEHQTATSEVLGIISRSPTDVQPVLDAIVESAARVCGIDDVVLRLRTVNVMLLRAHFGPMALAPVEVSIDAPEYRWICEHGTLHIGDVDAQRAAFPNLGLLTRFRTFLAAPLRQKDEVIGSLNARRMEVRPFTPAQIKLLETFADQAVIAIENVRLFNELKEALDQQTATSEILRVIASSPTDIQPVLNTIAANAARVSGSYDAVIRLVEGNTLRLAAYYGPVEPGFGLERPLLPGTATGRAIIERQTIHIPDIQAEAERFPDSLQGQPRGIRTFLVTPLLREGASLGVITIRRTEVKPFTDKQVTLLETFASQAVIAIENVRLFNELQERNRDLTEALEQQTATSKILEVIASSPTDIQPVLKAIAQSATRLCNATDAHISHVDGDILRLNADTSDASLQREVPITRNHIAGQAILDRRTIHIHDLATEPEEKYEAHRWRSLGFRTVLMAPLLREGTAIGTIAIRRNEARPFTEKQVALLETFANQAVIAIENTRLFKELQERNAELREALEHQTATAEMLGIISRSPTDVQPVLDAIVESAARVCGIDDVVLRLKDSDSMIPRAHFGSIPIGRVKISTDDPRFRWMREHGTLHLPDYRAQNDFPTGDTVVGYRTILSAPLRQHEELIGVLIARRMELRPFTPAQIKLLETFADQAVIAIENVRLFQELKESLEQQTATSEILGVIASLPTEIQPVLDTIAKNAAQVCGADDAAIRLVENDALRLVAHHGSIRIKEPLRPINRDSAVGRAVFERAVIHHEDLLAIVAKEYPVRAADIERLGIRTMLAAPLMRENQPIGVIIIRRTVVQPFSEKQISLLKTFASQAVIAIENVRLFKEIQERNAELHEALEHQTATAEVLGIISRSPTDVQPVLDAIVESAARVCGIDDVVLRLRYGDANVVRAHFGSVPMTAGREAISINELHYRWVREHGTLHIPDVHTQRDVFPTVAASAGARSRCRCTKNILAQRRQVREIRKKSFLCELGVPSAKLRTDLAR